MATSFNENLIVGAIDFGTTNSGWAYSFFHDFKNDPTKAFVKHWHSGSGTLSTEKAPTVVLIRPDGKTLEGFGYDAENRYRELADLGEHHDYYYFKKFKMMLHKQLSEKLDRNTELEDEMGKRLTALDIFAMSIKFLVDDMYKIVKLRVSGIIRQDEVHWVLTVPAIWTDSAKQFMREAAEKAGITKDKLSIALEPEAASIYCRNLPIEKTVGPMTASISSFPIGTKYMILDAGGGTIDVTVHEVIDSNAVKEVAAASGGGWGGTLVDHAFEDLIYDLVGKEVYGKFKQEQTEDWLEMMREFEVKKRTIHPDKEGRILMKFPVSLSKMSERKNRHDLEEFIRDSAEYADQVVFVYDKMKFTAAVFRNLFEKSNSKTIKHMKTVIQDNNLYDLKAILMVGGYSESPMLQEAVKKAFPHLEIIIPNEASSAILKGALIFGHLPEAVTERILKYTYGVDTTVSFLPGKHPNSKRMVTDSGIRCRNVFSKHVEMGQKVKFGHVQVKKSYTPAFRHQRLLSFTIYASTMKNPEYTDVDCFKIGSMTVDTVVGGLDCSVEVSLMFSGTEIKVEAKVKETGQKTDAVMNFLG
ncbi:heat shock 70 kDa protein 12B-like [Ruditapes philippinarum]|uniref:heat shock 70 kDa protein 12B-like n=1 Tax=Ruditapes philippinarum TaxID=129788 RepID=UPI00295AFABD|nr:heat shock 70 kDa protein 12B-like [Ruditapes philippinarum]